MTLTYYGHCTFMWTSPQGVSVLSDPFGNTSRYRWFLVPTPSVEAEIALVTHEHFDHNAVDGLPGQPSVLRGPGEFRRRDVTVCGVSDIHVSEPGQGRMRNTIFTIQSGGVRYCHLGDNRHEIPAAAQEELGDVDVLMITVDDSCHLLSYEEIDHVVALLAPRVVIPMHYYIEGLTTVESTLKPPIAWLARQHTVRRLDVDSLAIGPNDLPSEPEVWLFQPRRPVARAEETQR